MGMQLVHTHRVTVEDEIGRVCRPCCPALDWTSSGTSDGSTPYASSELTA